MSRVVRILSIDGGGIRGVIPAKILIHVESLLKEYSKNPNAKIGDYFDLIAGTSTGGIISALCLCPETKESNHPKYKAEDILGLYVNHGKQIFTRSFTTKYLDYFGLFSPIYQKETLEKILKAYLGDYRLSDLTRPCLIPSYDIDQGEAVFFNKMNVKKGSNEDLLVRDVIRATTAAPTYFPIAKMNQKEKNAYIDGGVFANNPALCAFIEATKFPCEPLQRDIFILSIGTGAKNRKYVEKDAKKWGRLGWIVPVIDIYGSAASQTVNHQLEMLYQKRGLNENYLRIEPNLNDYEVDTDLDNISDENIRALQKIGEEISHQYDAQLRAFIKKICENHTSYSHEELYKKQR